MTIEDDLHAYVIRKALWDRHRVTSYLVEVDRLSAMRCCLQWGSNANPRGTLRLPEGDEVDLAEVDVVWWRRSRADQRLDVSYTEASHTDLINQDWRAALRGSLVTLHKGAWISHPEATERAANKLYQLAVAEACGFRVPKTIVSNNPTVVREFVSAQVAGAIVKPVAGTRHSLLFTQRVTSQELADDESILACPATYQEYIPGTRHIRLNQFGDQSFAAEIDTANLDWRADLRTDVRTFKVPENLRRLCVQVLDELRLRMGVIDIKLDEHDQPVWFEVNPQGQFLFVEGMTGMPLTEYFVDFLVEEMKPRM